MGVEFRDVFFEGNRFYIQGNGVDKLNQEQIEELCKKTLEASEGYIKETNLDVTITNLGRQYVQKEKIQYTEPKPQEIKRFSFLRNLCSRFLDFIKRRPLSPAEKQAAELRFAMQVFDSEDTHLLEQLFPVDGREIKRGIKELSFSQVLERWVEGLDAVEKKPSSAESVKQRQLLRNLCSYQQKIEKIQTMRLKRERVQAREKLIEQITGSIDGLKEGESVYVPGGIWRAEKEEPYPMIYQVTKTAEMLNVDAIDMSTEIVASKKQPDAPLEGQIMVKANKSKEFVRETIMLLSSREVTMKRPEGLLRALFSMIKSKISDAIFGPDEWEEYSRGISPIDVESEELQKKISHEEVLAKRGYKKFPEEKERQKVVPGLLTELFIKKASPDLSARHRFLVKTKTFFSIWQSAESFLVEKEFRSWIAHNAESLSEQIQNLGLNELEKKILENKLKNIAEQIEQYDKQLRLPVFQTTKMKTSFEDAIAPSCPHIAITSISARSVKPIALVESLDMSHVLEELDLVQFQQHIQSMKDMVGKKKFEQTHMYIKEAFLALEGVDIVALARNEKFTEWLNGIKELSFLLPRISFGMKRLSPSSEDMRFYLQALHLQDEVLRKRVELGESLHQDTKKKEFLENYILTSAFEMAPIERVLKNPYINLGDDSKAIYDHIAYFKNLRKFPFRGNSPDIIQGRDIFLLEHERKSFDEAAAKYKKIHELEDKIEKIKEEQCKVEKNEELGSEEKEKVGLELNQQRQDYEQQKKGLQLEANKQCPDFSQKMQSFQDIGQKNILPKLLVNARQSYCLMQAFFAPTRVFVPYTREDFLAIAGKVAAEVGGASINEIIQRGGDIAFPRMVEKVCEYACSRVVKGDITFKYVKNPVFGQPCFVVEPWDMAVLDMDDPLFQPGFGTRFDFEHPGNFDKNGIPVEHPMLRKCFEQVVSKNFYGKQEGTYHAVQDDGSIEDVSIAFIDHRMKGRTEWQILQDQATMLGLSPHVLQDLQLMQTGPKSVVPNTLAFLSQHIALLGDTKIGFPLARLLERNIFRNGVFNQMDQKFVFGQIKELFDQAQITGTNIAACIHLFEIARKIYANAQDIEALKPEFEELLKKFKSLEEDFNKQGLLRPYLGVRLAAYDMQMKQGEKIPVDTIWLDLFRYEDSPSAHVWTDPMREAAIKEMAMKFLPQVKKLPNPPEICSSLLKALYPEVTEEEWVQSDKDGFVFESKPYKVNLARFEIWKDGIRKRRLPTDVTTNPLFLLFERLIQQKDEKYQVREEDWVAKPVEIPSEIADQKRCHGIQYEATVGTSLFRIIAGDDGTLRLYRCNKGEPWYLFHDNIFAKAPLERRPDFLPRHLEQGDCWIRSDGQKMNVELKGKVKLRASVARGGLVENIERVKDHHRIGNIAQDRGMRRLFDMESPAYVTAYGKKELNQIEYERFNYGFEKQDDRWVSQQHEGYHLSNETLESYAAPPSYSEDVSRNEHVERGLEHLQRLFHPSFTYYHLLKHDTKFPKLVMPGVAFGLQKTVTGKELSYKFLPQWQEGELDSLSLYEFDVDPIKGLIPKKQPEGYLYLAYVLCIQGNTKDALYYFQRANFNRSLDERGKELFSRLEGLASTLPEDSSEGALLRARLFLAKPIVRNEKPDTLMRGLFAKQSLDRLKKNYSDQKLPLTDRERVDLERLSKASWFSIFAVLSEDEENKEILKKVSSLLNFVCFDPEKYEDKVKLHEDLIQRVNTYEGITEEDRIHLHAYIPEAVSYSTLDEGLQFEQFKTLQSISVWNQFEEKILKPFDIGLEELISMKESGLFEKFQELAQKFTGGAEPAKVFSPKDIQTLIEATRVRENFLLQRRIDELQKSLKAEHAPPSVKRTSPVALFVEIPGKECFKEDTDEGLSSKLKTDEVRAKEGERKTYEQEIDGGLCDDFRVHVRESSDVAMEVRKAAGLSEEKEGVKPKIVTNQDKLCGAIKDELDKKNGNALRLRREVLDAFPSVSKPELRGRFKRVGRITQDAFFDTVLRCYGEGDWEAVESLLKPGADVEFVKKNIHEFLKNSVQAKQLQTAFVAAKKMSEDTAEFKQASREIYDLLTAKWQYDVDKDPLAATVLLIEYELGFICRSSQLAVVEENLTKDNRFKQEICGGGKTTVLRNIISQFRADGTTLSGVSTLEPLRGEHGLMYARTTMNAFGQQVFDFHFTARSASDLFSLRQLQCDLLETAVSRGRIDLTKGDLQSFKNAMVLKREKIRQSRQSLKDVSGEEAERVSKEIETLHREFDLMEDIRDFLIKHAKIMADELDEDCNPSQEKNLAYGKPQSFNETERAAACSLMRMLFSAEEGVLKDLKEAFQKNLQARSSEDVRNNALKELAERVYDECKEEIGDVSQDSFVKYLTEASSKEAKAVYKSLYGGKKEFSPTLEKIAFYRQFLSDVIPKALTKTAGVRYGRSCDGESVIPYIGSSKPKEGSVHGTEQERIWYTCADYMQNGVLKDQVRAVWIQAKEQATRELLRARQQGSEEIQTIDDTSAAKDFIEKYATCLKDKKFSEIQESDLEKLCERFTQDPNLMIDYLEGSVLPLLRQEEEKIVSDSQDAPHMVQSYSGSSGTDTGQYALPDKINTEDCRQEGVHGRVIRSLKESELRQEGKGFLSCTDEQGPDDILAQEMKGGDCLVDVGKLYPGKPPKEIARNLLARMPKEVEYVVFMDNEDRWKMLAKDGRELKYRETKDPELLKRRITIFDDVHTRGAERDSMEGVTEFVTLDVDTDWSRFEQAVSRERFVLKNKATVRYILSPELKKELGEDIALDAIREKLLSKNEADHLQQLNYKAERQRVKHILKRVGEEALRAMSELSRKRATSQHHRLREELFTLERDLFIVSNKIDVLQVAEPLGEERSSVALDRLVDQQLVLLDRILAQLTTYSKEERNPVGYDEINTPLKAVPQKLDSLLVKQKKLKDAIVDMDAKAKKAWGPLMDKIREQTQEAKKELTSAKTTEQIEGIHKQKEKLERLIASEEKFKQLTEEMRMDVGMSFRKMATSSRHELAKILNQIRKQKAAMTAKIAETEKQEIEPEKPVESVSQWLLQKIEKGARGVLEKVTVKAVAFGTKYANWRTEGGKTQVTQALDELDQSVVELDKALEELEKPGKPLADIATETLEKARPLLWAKYSDDKRKQTPSELAAKVEELVADGKGRIDAKYLPEKVAGSSELDNEQEVETEEEQEVEVPAEVSIEAEEELGVGEQIYKHRQLLWDDEKGCLVLKDPPTFKSMWQDNFIYLDLFTPEDHKFLNSNCIDRAGNVSFEALWNNIDHSKLKLEKFPKLEFASIHKLSDFSDFQMSGKIFTENCYPVERSKGALRPWEIKDGKPFLPADQNRIERSLFVVNTETGKVQEIYGSRLDIDGLFTDLAKQRQQGKFRFFIFNYGMRKVDTGELVVEQKDQIMQHVAATMLQRGDVEFPKTKEFDFNDALLTFLQSRDDLISLENGVKAAIKKYRPDVLYEGSSLEQSFTIFKKGLKV